MRYTTLALLQSIISLANMPNPTVPSHHNSLVRPPQTQELVAIALATVVKEAQANGKSLSDLQAQVLEEEPILDSQTRRWLSQVITDAWHFIEE
jgi:hypothetical protein